MFDGPQRHDNITDTALSRYRDLYGADVTADDVFYACTDCCIQPSTGTRSPRT